MKCVYQHGDLAGIPWVTTGDVLPKAAERIFSPHTKLFHWVLIADYIQAENDYVILEAINPSGFRVGRLSWYCDYRVFRPTTTQQISIRTIRVRGQRACRSVTRYGRSGYDHGFIFRLPIDVLVCWAKQFFTTGRCHAIRAEELPYKFNDRLCCTEAVVLAWRLVGIWIVPPGVKPLPCAIVAAINEGRLKEVT